MAVILEREGDRAAAGQWWRRFIETAGTAPGVPADTIMMPETYRTRLSEADNARSNAIRLENERQEAARLESDRQEAARLEQERQEAARREAERIENELRAKQEPSTVSVEPSGQNDVAEIPVTVESTDIATGIIEAGGEELAAADQEEAPTSAAGVTEQLEDLSNRVHRGIRRGLYSIITVLMLLFGGIAGIALFIRHRRRQREFSLGFAEEIDNALKERLEEEEVAIELTGVSAEKTFSEQSLRIQSYDDEIGNSSQGIIEPHLEESLEPRPPYVPPPPSEREFSEPVTAVSFNDTVMENMEGEEAVWELPRERYESPPPPLPSISERPPITEEVKSLVTRMSREGRSVNDICRAADLTRTEVELILAVRSRHTENLVLNYARDREADADAESLYKAVRELAADGESEIGIARKLGISRSEAAMAIKVMQKWR
jgi:hypothetical protein